MSGPPIGFYEVGKRLFDLAVASAVLAVTSPLIALSAAAVWVTMGSPVFFRQARAGLHEKVFTVIKLRTMRGLRPGEREIASDADRLTPLGRLLRVTSLDELPTLLNVLKGDMSLVGPRPLFVEYLPRYSARQARRHEVKPGITGWAQVNGRNDVSWEEKFELDVWYVDHRSLALDLKILLMTVWKVLKREGISMEGTATAREFMGHYQP